MKWKTQTGQIMDIKEMTDSHLLNAIAYTKRHLAKDPGEGYYMGDSIYAEDAVRLENEHNDRVRESLSETIEKLEKEKIKRSL